MAIGDLLNQLFKVKPAGRGKWLACCPSHKDRDPSLSIRELDDGRVLLHCFAGCDVEEVLGAVGLTFEALYPPREIEHGKRVRRPWQTPDVLKAIAYEALVASVAASNMSRGIILSIEDEERLRVAAVRLQNAAEAANE